MSQIQAPTKLPTEQLKLLEQIYAKQGGDAGICSNCCGVADFCTNCHGDRLGCWLDCQECNEHFKKMTNPTHFAICPKHFAYMAKSVKIQEIAALLDLYKKLATFETCEYEKFQEDWMHRRPISVKETINFLSSLLFPSLLNA